ncbi:hypothetical protein CDAR_294571 [Caerostris darwini]|uniref:Uncharacterized protein n=1 Tax=Caerostris darwini TaxID=1538125 RepID=A0AAV4UL88_9ARAC|nr:hypothetical protein CDAR_294571 [Caerostris darwini]
MFISHGCAPVYPEHPLTAHAKGVVRSSVESGASSPWERKARRMSQGEEVLEKTHAHATSPSKKQLRAASPFSAHAPSPSGIPHERQECRMAKLAEPRGISTTRSDDGIGKATSPRLIGERGRRFLPQCAFRGISGPLIIFQLREVV